MAGRAQKTPGGRSAGRCRNLVSVRRVATAKGASSRFRHRFAALPGAADMWVRREAL